MMHEHAQTWSVLKSLYSSPGETGTTGSTLGPNTKTALAAGSHGSGGALSTTGNPEPATGNGINQLIELSSLRHSISPKINRRCVLVKLTYER